MKKEFAYVRDGLIVAVILIGLSFLLRKLSAAGVIGADISDRAAQVVIGLVVVWSGNMVPKRLAKLSDGGCEPARQQSRRRFAGWALVLAGLAYTVIWLVAPPETAWIISISVLGGTLLLVVVPCVWLIAKRPGSRATGS